ncbi:MAG: hypothetical protein CK550_04590 [Gemmatimonadetes bacterium]|jgi:hypothetical protein|uniref:hypothetical protein n=1 Tax=Gemmatimonas sp. TaxID=1962908 RepID=UPI000C132D7F|nr:MAG: hypothetical protein CK550_04590 [Gemmatimonadota bacterium]
MQAFVRRMLAPVLTITALSFTATIASAFTGQPKPQLSIEAERSPQGARITFKGKNWPAAARIKLTATRAPASTKPQDFGIIDADSTGTFTVRKVAICTTQNQEDGALETVTFTAADSATGVKATATARGNAWVCQ